MEYKLPIFIKDARSGEQVTTEALNISDSGVYVDAAKLLKVNSDVICRFTSAEKELALQGTVKWTYCTADKQISGEGKGREKQHTQTLVELGGEQSKEIRPKATLAGGMGIGFNNLSEEERHLLRTLRERIDIKPTTVRLWLPGVKDPVSAQGVPTHNGLVLETQLPFLRLGSPLSFSLGDIKAFYEGKLTRVEIDTNTESAIPLLCVGIDIDSHKEPTRRLYFLENVDVSDRRQDDASLDSRFLQEAMDGDSSEEKAIQKGATAPARPSYSRRRDLAQHALTAIIAASIGTLVTWHVSDKSPSENEDFRTQLDRSLKTEVSAVVKGKKKDDAIVKRKEQRKKELGPEFSVKKLEAPQPDKPSEFALEDKGATETKAGADTTSISRDKPEVTVYKNRTRVLVPLTGSDEKMRKYRLSTPGIAVNLPRARALVPYSNYGVHQGLIKRVWIRRYRSGTQVRVITTRSAVRHKVSFSSEGLEMVLTP